MLFLLLVEFFLLPLGSRGYLKSVYTGRLPPNFQPLNLLWWGSVRKVRQWSTVGK